MKIGYVRVSTVEQNTVRQDVMMKELGVEKVFVDKMSGKNTDRPGLQEMLEYMRDGDTIVVESISRFARSTRDLLDLVQKLTDKGVEFVSLKESIDTSTPQGRFMLTVFGAMAEMEREQILQRQREGIEAAKDAGKYTGRKPIELDQTEFENVYKQWEKGDITVKGAMKVLGVSKNTFYRRVWEYQDAHGIPRKGSRR